MTRRPRPPARPTARKRRRLRSAPLFKRIMVPVDLSDRNERSLQAALGLLRERGGSVTLFHVIQRVPGITSSELETFYQQLVESSKHKLQQAARKFAERGLDVRIEVRVGEPAAEIVGAVLRERVDLVVMESRKVRSGSRQQGWGTTSYKVGIFCQCPILLVPK